MIETIYGIVAGVAFMVALAWTLDELCEWAKRKGPREPSETGKRGRRRR